jgi:hypothetical protein
MKNYDVVRLERSQIAHASEIAANAFADDPVFSYLMPADKRSRLQALTWLTSKILDYCITCDRAYTTSDLGGVAAWLPPDRSSTNGLQLVRMAMQFQLYLLPIGRYVFIRKMDLKSLATRNSRRILPYFGL